MGGDGPASASSPEGRSDVVAVVGCFLLFREMAGGSEGGHRTDIIEECSLFRWDWKPHNVGGSIG